MAAHITLTAVTDEGDTVIVWSRPKDAPDDTEPDGYVFQAKGTTTLRYLQSGPADSPPGQKPSLSTRWWWTGEISPPA
jgi:hypothetical protein